MLNPPKLTTRVRTLCTTYGARQKQQVANLTKIPTGTIGIVRHVGYDDDTSCYVLTIFWIDGKKLFAKLSPNVIEEVKENV